jgi:anti-sigma regulatory factor (Ser/Thr protein kinase)
MGTYRRRRFPPTPEAVPQARAFLREVLPRTVSEDAAADLALALSELAANAVKHARTPFEVVVDTDGVARIEVEDQSPVPPVPRHAAPTDSSGRGLALVAQLCDRWGVHIHITQDAKCVWCERDLSAAG